MVLAISRNQRTVEFDGVWMWRESETPTIVTADRNALFQLPKGSRILGGFIDVESAATGTTVTGTINLENDGGDVALATDVNLKAAGRTAIDVADEGIEADVGTGTSVDVVLDITSSSPGNAPVITVGLEVARPNYLR